MRYLFILMILFGCKASEVEKTTMQELNDAVIDGFYDGDTVAAHSGYLIKTESTHYLRFYE